MYVWVCVCACICKSWFIAYGVYNWFNQGTLCSTHRNSKHNGCQRRYFLFATLFSTYFWAEKKRKLVYFLKLYCMWYICFFLVEGLGKREMCENFYNYLACMDLQVWIFFTYGTKMSFGKEYGMETAFYFTFSHSQYQ